MELIVRKDTEIKGEIDAAGEPLMNPDGTFVSTTKDTFSYFRWNGAELVPVK